ncbi:MAG: MarR family winged helix-turn-helix transcriptional regulator [Thermomicrobiales bacterium]
MPAHAGHQHTEAKTADELPQANACARQTLELLPVLRRWVTARVHWAGADVGLSVRQYAALHGIREGAASPGELARLWQVTPAVITGIIDRLESRGMVRREPDPWDRRRLRLALTDAGLQASQEIESALTGDLAAQLASASPNELAELGQSLDLLQQTFATLEARTPRPVSLVAGEDMPVWDDEHATEASAPPDAKRARTVRRSARTPALEA